MGLLDQMIILWLVLIVWLSYYLKEGTELWNCYLLRQALTPMTSCHTPAPASCGALGLQAKLCLTGRAGSGEDVTKRRQDGSQTVDMKLTGKCESPRIDCRPQSEERCCQESVPADVGLSQGQLVALIANVAMCYITKKYRGWRKPGVAFSS